MKSKILVARLTPVLENPYKNIPCNVHAFHSWASVGESQVVRSNVRIPPLQGGPALMAMWSATDDWLATYDHCPGLNPIQGM